MSTPSSRSKSKDKGNPRKTNSQSDPCPDTTSDTTNSNHSNKRAHNSSSSKHSKDAIEKDKKESSPPGDSSSPDRASRSSDHKHSKEVSSTTSPRREAKKKDQITSASTAPRFGSASDSLVPTRSTPSSASSPALRHRHMRDQNDKSRSKSSEGVSPSMHSSLGGQVQHHSSSLPIFSPFFSFVLIFHTNDMY